MDSKRKNKYAILIVAAGQSKRLGQPKQLVRWGHSTLLDHTIKMASQVPSTDVYVILGSEKETIESSLSNTGCTIIYNPDYTLGMGGSIAVGMRTILTKDFEAVTISVCDQPYLTENIFSTLIQAFENAKGTIITSKYTNSSGPPTLFSKKYFIPLSALKGDQGAKALIKQHHDEVFSVPFPLGHIDIDTPEDLKNLKTIRDNN